MLAGKLRRLPQPVLLGEESLYVLPISRPWRWAVPNHEGHLPKAVNRGKKPSQLFGRTHRVATVASSGRSATRMPPMSDKLLTMIADSSHWPRRRTELRCASRPTGQQCLPVGESSIDVSLRRLAEEYLNFVELAGEDDLVVLRCTRSAG